MHQSKWIHSIIKAIIIVALFTQSTIELRAQDKQTQKNNKTNMPLEVVRLYPFKTHYTVKKGQELKFSYEQNASIGITADYYIEDSSMIEYVEEKEANENGQEENASDEINEDDLILLEPKPQPSEDDGPDGAYDSINFTFKALKTGNAKIIIRKYYRLDLEKTYEFKINIE